MALQSSEWTMYTKLDGKDRAVRDSAATFDVVSVACTATAIRTRPGRLDRFERVLHQVVHQAPELVRVGADDRQLTVAKFRVEDDAAAVGLLRRSR